MTFIYSVEYLDLNDKPATNHGAISASSFTEAMTTIEDVYSNDLIAVTFLRAYDCPVLIIPEDCLAAVKKAQG